MDIKAAKLRISLEQALVLEAHQHSVKVHTARRFIVGYVQVLDFDAQAEHFGGDEAQSLFCFWLVFLVRSKGGRKASYEGKEEQRR